MSLRSLLLLIVLLPIALVGGAAALGQRIPVPEWGRGYVIRVPLGESTAPLEMPPVRGSADPARPLVVIDAGHGGRDPGAIGVDGEGRSLRESDIALAIALALRDKLVEGGGIRVALTREDDRFLPLGSRPEIARRLDADLFLSIHADSASESAQASGASVYTLSAKASSEAAARNAARENDADRLNGIIIEGASDAVAAILVDLSQQRTQGRASEFAALIAREGKDRLAFHPETQRSAALAVLRAPDVPSVLFESGFITSRSDRARLTTAAGRAEYASVLARAVRVYFARNPAEAEGETAGPD